MEEIQGSRLTQHGGDHSTIFWGSVPLGDVPRNSLVRCSHRPYGVTPVCVGDLSVDRGGLLPVASNLETGSFYHLVNSYLWPPDTERVSSREVVIAASCALLPNSKGKDMNNNGNDPSWSASNVEPQEETPQEPAQLVVQGVARKHPLRWSVTNEGHAWITQPLYAVPVLTDKIRNLVGVKDAAKRIVDLAKAIANDETMSNRRRRLEGLYTFVQPILFHVKQDLARLRSTKKNTSRLERYAVGRTELPVGEKWSLAIWGELVIAAFWGALFAIGCVAELAVGQFNIARTEMEGMTNAMAWIVAFLPFVGTFAALKWIDPSDIDRDRYQFYKWMTRSAFVVTPIGMYLFAAKLEVLLETDYSNASASTGPSYTWVIVTMQISFAIAIYLSSIKLGDAWWKFLGYEVRKTREFLEVCEDIATSEDAFQSLIGIVGRADGAIAAIDARETKAVETYRGRLDDLVSADTKRRNFIKDSAEAAAAKARVDAGNATER